MIDESAGWPRFAMAAPEPDSALHFADFVSGNNRKIGARDYRVLQPSLLEQSTFI